jgi:hypothetical protein
MVVAGYCADPNPANLYFVQLHDNPNPIVPGDTPKVIVPVWGGYGVYSYAVETEFTNGGVQIALSTTELVFTAPAADYLTWNSLARLAI